MAHLVPLRHPDGFGSLALRQLAGRTSTKSRHVDPRVAPVELLEQLHGSPRPASHIGHQRPGRRPAGRRSPAPRALCRGRLEQRAVRFPANRASLRNRIAASELVGHTFAASSGSRDAHACPDQWRAPSASGLRSVRCNQPVLRLVSAFKSTNRCSLSVSATFITFD